MKPATVITVLLGLVSSSFALELSRLFWNQSPTTPEDAHVIEIVRWRQPICVVPDEGVLPCSHTLRKFQTEYERFNGKTLDGRRTERSRINLESSIASMDEESTIELIIPGVEAPEPVNNSHGASEGFSEGNISEFHLKTPELTQDQGKNIRLDRSLDPEGVLTDEEVRIELAAPEAKVPSNPRSPEVSGGSSAENSSQFHLKTPELTQDQGKNIRKDRSLAPEGVLTDEEVRIELAAPEAKAPSNPRSSEVSGGFSAENSSQFHLKTPELTQDQGKNIRLDRSPDPEGVLTDEEVRIELAAPESKAPSHPRSPEVSEVFSAKSTSEFLLKTKEGASSSTDEATIDLLPPEAKAPSNPRSPEVSGGFSAENSSQFRLKTPELPQDQGKNIRIDRRFASGSSSSKLQKIYVTKVLESPMTATLVARNCLPDIGVPFCEDYQDYIQPAKPYVDPKPTLTISAEIESVERRQRHVHDSYPRRNTVQGFFVGSSPQKFVIIDFNSTRSPMKLQDADAEAADRSGVRSVHCTIKNPSQSKDSELATVLSKKTEGNATGSSRVPGGSEGNNSGIADGWSIGDEESSGVPIRVPRFEGPDVPALSGLFEELEDGDRKESLRRPMGKEFPESDSSGMGDTRFGTVEEEFDKDYVGRYEYTEPDVPVLASLFEGLEDNHQEKSLMKPTRKLEDLESSNVDRNRDNSLVDLPKDQVSNVSVLSSPSKNLEDNHRESLKEPVAKLESSESGSSNLTGNHSNTVKEESLRVPMEETKKTMMEIPSRDNASNVAQKIPDPVLQVSLAKPGGSLEAPESNRSFTANNLTSTVEEGPSKVPEEEMKKTSTMIKISSQNNTSNDGLTTPGLLNVQQKLPDPVHPVSLTKPAENPETPETNQPEANTMVNNLNGTVKEESIEAPVEEMKNVSTMVNSSSIQKIPDTASLKPSTKPSENSEGFQNSTSSFSQEKDQKISQESDGNATTTETSTTTLQTPSQKTPHKYGQRLNRTSTKTPTRTRVIGHRNYRPGHMFHRRKGTSPRLKLKPSNGNSTRVGAARRKYNKSRLAWVKPRQ